MKKIFCLFLIILCFLVSCQKKEEEATYKTDVSAVNIASSVFDTIKLETLTKADNGWIALNIPVDSSLYSECTVYLSTTGAADHFGIFKADSKENAEKILKQSEKYLTDLEENWMSEYLPEELPKVQKSVCKRLGQYVFFLVLDEDVKISAEKAIEEMLKP